MRTDPRQLPPNHLGRAGEMRGRIGEAMSRDAIDAAWKLAHEIQNQYLLHAEHEHFDRAQMLRLSASVQKITADTLRRQGRQSKSFVTISFIRCTQHRYPRRK